MRELKRETPVDGIPKAYFRGRKLHGREIRVPDGYRGVVVQERKEEGRKSVLHQSQPRLTLGEAMGASQSEDGDDEEDDDAVRALEEAASFDQIIVWGHESVADDGHVFVKGMAEWTHFAEAVSHYGIERIEHEEY